jgi:S-DNA-T family DNA segregation ATPase FtsK/SpoIIIE
MKPEHKKWLAKAHKMNMPASEFAAELLGTDLINACLKEIKQMPEPWPKLSEAQQNEIINRIEETCKEGAQLAVKVINARGAVAVPVELKDIRIHPAIKITVTADKNDPEKHSLIDASGKTCLLILAPDDYHAANDAIRGEADQKEFDGLDEEQDPEGEGEGTQAGAGLEALAPANDEPDPLIENAKSAVIETGTATVTFIQKRLKVGYNRAARILEQLEEQGVVTAPTSGRREVIHGAYVAPADTPAETMTEGA